MRLSLMRLSSVHLSSVRVSCACAIACVASHAAGAQTLSERNLSTALAVEAAEAALDRCSSQNHKVSVAVVDRTGRTRVLLRGDDARPHTMDSSQRKAYTAFTFRNSTNALAEGLAHNPGNAPLFTLPDLLPLAGGVPIRAGNEVIGGIGVGGAPAGTIDEACASAGVEKIKDRLQ
ncbi:MAG: GlcG/HbpS family heme-binding protein [Gemmatimonas sp.]